MRIKKPLLFLFVTVSAGVMWPSDASAYIGPGVGLSAIGALLALIAAVAMALFGFIWFPIKRLARRMKQQPSKAPARSRG